ncbi:DUF1116 domain-containing protein [Solirubrobacter ginsenosidimutans]|uniref:DUF1116 domain-containing protein n=1 Tax=Solirubrobacter ginsenosidimutans TaxID=490573 RepID=A0A9X3S059_9ACTN|nr:DUF1116 domain-containing protein [Solirubrobacter ginsenosidimutans]MDA0159677.1 DUF1116 domain-containing protein [Solirubrobacter ginsenosidimutans]
MTPRADVLTRVEAVNLGLSTFADALRAQDAPVVQVDWRPPAGGDATMLDVLTRLWGRHGRVVGAANADAVARIEGCSPRAVTVAAASSVVPGLEDGVLLHSGPPIAWERVCDPQRRALLAAVVFEGWAASRAEAASLLERGEITLAPGNEHDHVGPMTGVCSPSMPVWVVEDGARRAFSTLNEGPGNTLWFGVGDDEAVSRLRFFRDDLGPRLARMLEHRGPIDVFGLAAQGLNMGDELHMRSQATGNLLLRELAASIAVVGGEEAARFIAGNHHFFLNLTMAASKCASLALDGCLGSSVVSLISRNGVEVGVQLAGMPGRWFVAPAATVDDALLRGGHTADDAARDIGDSAVIECIGLGGMALAAAPVVASFFGGNAAAAAARTELMAQICAARSERFTLANRDHVGTPVGIDARLVAELDVTPQITTGVLHGHAGTGQIGAGVAHQPVAPFRAAITALAAELDGD